MSKKTAKTLFYKCKNGDIIAGSKEYIKDILAKYYGKEK